MVLVKGVRVEDVCPLLVGARQHVPGPVALLGGGGLQSWGKPCWGPRPRVQPGCALGAEGRVETRLWEWWRFPALLQGQGV